MGTVDTIIISNVGPADATSLVVTDSLPDGVAYTSDSGNGAYDTAVPDIFHLLTTLFGVEQILFG